MSRLPSSGDRSRELNSEHSQTLRSRSRYLNDSSNALPLPDLNLVPEFDLCPDLNQFFSYLFDRHFDDRDCDDRDCGPDLGFGSPGDLDFWGFRDGEEEDHASVFGLHVGFECDHGFRRPHYLHYEGLRVAGIDSNSDYDDGVLGMDSLSFDGESGGSYLGQVDFGLRLAGTDSDSEIDPEAEWEEIISGVDERRSMSTGMDSSVSSLGDEDLDFGFGLRNLEDLDVNMGLDFNADGDDMSYLGIVQDNGEDVFEELVENVGALRRSLPVARSVMEELPVVEMVRPNNGVCAICMEEIAGGEKVRRLPCKHYYHGDCILPWLGERNTCPLCRFELPTEEDDEESWWRPEAGPTDGGIDQGDDDNVGLPWDLPVRFNFQFFA